MKVIFISNFFKVFTPKSKLKLNISNLEFGSTGELLSDKRLTILYGTLFIVWVVVTALAVSRGSRFITTIVLPFGLMAGIFVGFATDYVKNKLDNDKWIVALVFLCAFLAGVPLGTINTVWGVILFAAILGIGLLTVYGIKSTSATQGTPIKKYVVIIAIVIALITPSICGAWQTSDSVVPGTSDPMYNSMTWIQETQPDDTVITSWWDFGYLFEIAADRQVTFDGGSQSGDRAYWVGKALTTSDFAQSKGILQMLGTTGSNASELLCNYTGSNVTAVDALDKILGMSREDAKSTLVKDYNLTESQASAVVKQSHPSNPNNVAFVLSSDMIQKAGWWSYFGSWNFDTLDSTNYQYYVAPNYVTIKPNSQGSIPVLNDSNILFSADVKRGSNGTNQTTAQMTAVWANNGSKVNLNGTDYNPLKASNLIAIEDGYLTVNKTLDKEGNFTLYLIGSENDYTAVLMDNKLRDSVFTRLFLLGGAGQDTFTLTNMQEGVSTWSINGASSSSDSQDTNTTET